MKLFMLRLENGNSVILQAESQEEAVERAGLRVDPAAVAAQNGAKDVAQQHYELVASGVGPQNFTIRELSHFFCMAVLADDGTFAIHTETEEADEEFFEDYPAVWTREDALLEELDVFDPRWAPRREPLIKEAVQKERTRLLIGNINNAQ
jgi:hypothetical protein